MLASGAHVKIGDYEYVLDESTGAPYLHEYQPLFPSGGGEIVGTDGKRVTRPDLLFWSADDWTGGQGFKTYDPRDPVTYWYSTANTRNPGEITSPPTRTAATGLSATTANKTVHLAVGDGKVWLASSRQLFYSSDGMAWTAHASNPIGTAGDEITAIVADGPYLYVATHTDPTTTGTREVLRATTSALDTYVSNVTSALPFGGLGVMDGGLFGWTGTSLVKYNRNPASLPITHAATDVKYQPMSDNLPNGAVYKMVQGGKSLFFMTTSYGRTQIWEWRKDVPTPIWEMPVGFKAVDLCVANDTLYVLGEYGTDKAGLWGMNLTARVPLYMAEIEDPDSANHDPVAINPSFGNQIIMLFDTGATAHKVYVYDSEYDGVSYLSTSSTYEGHDLITYRNKRIIAGNRNSTTVDADYISLDSNSNTTSTAWDVYGPRWDFGYPFSKKLLHGFHVTLKSLPANAVVTLYYALDGTTSWTQVTSTITTDGATYAYLPVSTTSATVSFRNLRVRVRGTYAATVLSVTAQAQLVEYSESWKLRLRLKDEAGHNPRSRLTSARAETLRTNLRTLVTNKAVVSFLDGYRYRNPGAYSSHDVTIEFPSDGITSDTEGIAEVILRSVTNA